MTRFFFQLLLLPALLSVSPLKAQVNFTKADQFLLDSILSHTPGLADVWKKADSCRVQIIFTRLIHRKNGKIVFENHSFHLDDELYFYPASIVKLPLSLLALEKMNKLKAHGVSLDSRLSVEENYSCQTEVIKDKLANKQKPTIRNYILKALIISNNEAYNRLYEFVGPSYIHKRLGEMGYPKARIITRFAACDSIENRHTNAFRFYNSKGRKIWYQPPAVFNKPLYPPLLNMKVGIASATDKDTVQLPKDFSNMNCFLLKDMHDFLERLVYPKAFKPVFHITEKNRLFLLQCLGAKPSECPITSIARDPDYFDASTNYLYYGAERDIAQNSSLMITNIVGQSYGFLTDVAYFRDVRNKVEFFLSAVLYTNASGIVGTGVYEYRTIGFPFLRDLGQTLYNYEMERNRKK